MTNHEIFAYKTLFSVNLFLFWGYCFGNGGSTIWVTITWSFMVQTLKILTDAHTSNIVHYLERIEPHPQGICMLLEVNILNELINYSEGLHQNPNVLFELKGVHINEKQCDMTDISYQQLSAVPLEANHADAEITTIHIPLLCCCATSFYSICFSIIKYCGYWNSQALDRITDHANKFYKEKLNGDNHPLTINNFPRTLQIYDADINIAFNLEKQGIQ